MANTYTGQSLPSGGGRNARSRSHSSLNCPVVCGLVSASDSVSSVKAFSRGSLTNSNGSSFTASCAFGCEIVGCGVVGGVGVVGGKGGNIVYFCLCPPGV